MPRLILSAFLLLLSCKTPIEKEIHLQSKKASTEPKQETIKLVLEGFEGLPPNVFVRLCKWEKHEDNTETCEETYSFDGKIVEPETTFYLEPGVYSGRIGAYYQTYRPFRFNYYAWLSVGFGDENKYRSYVKRIGSWNDCSWGETKSPRYDFYYICPSLDLTHGPETIRLKNIKESKFNQRKNVAIYGFVIYSLFTTAPYLSLVFPLIYGSAAFENKIQFLNSKQTEPFIQTDKERDF